MSQQKNQEDILNIKDIIINYLSYWKWIVLALILSLSIGFLYLLRTNNLYEIKSSILIKSDDESGVTESAILDDLGLSTTGKKNIDNEIEILKSADLIKSTIYATNFYTNYSIKTGLKKAKLYKDSPISIEIENINLDTLRNNIDFIVEKESNGYIVKSSYLNTFEEKKVERLPATIRFSYGTIVIKNIKQWNFSQNEIFISIQNPERLAVAISDAIKITPTSKKSSVILLSIYQDNMKKGEDFLHKLVELYNLQAVEDKNQISYNTSVFIDERLRSLSTELSNVEENVEKFKSKNKITDISSEAELFLTQTGSYEEKVKEVETQLSIIKYIDEFICNDKNKNHLIPNIGITDPGLMSLIDKYNQLTLEKERIEKSSTSENPALNNLLDQLRNMRSGIKNSVSNVRKTLLITKKDLDEDESNTSKRIQQIPRIEREFVEIKRQQQIKETLYLFLLQKREETSLSLAATSYKAKIVSQPRADITPVSPQKMVVLLISLLLGIGIPIVIIYLKDTFQTKITNRAELDKFLDAPVLGNIPKCKENDGIVVSINDTSSVTELFRSLRNDLKFILSASDKKVITVTSTISGEGKTFITTNLASTFSMIEKKVIVVGLDIRNPSLATYLGLEKKQGLTSYLAMGGNIDQFIEKCPSIPNLDIIQAGIIPPNPNELLSRNNLDSLFEELKNRYDYIIIDTAPVGIISDTFLVNRLSNITLYVTRENVTDKNSISFINDLYNNDRLKNIYIIFNDADLEKKRYGYNYYYKNKKSKRYIQKYSLSNMRNFISKRMK